MTKFYCECCGTHYSSVSSLTSSSCSKNPNSKTHKLYEGPEKSRYTCKYCGTQYSSLSSLTSSSCNRHPSGKGKHVPAL